jgi:hypothetical protein
MGVVNLIGATAFERDLESFHSGGIHSRYDTFVSGASVAPRNGFLPRVSSQNKCEYGLLRANWPRTVAHYWFFLNFGA